MPAHQSIAGSNGQIKKTRVREEKPLLFQQRCYSLILRCAVFSAGRLCALLKDQQLLVNYFLNNPGNA